MNFGILSGRDFQALSGCTKCVGLTFLTSIYILRKGMVMRSLGYGMVIGVGFLSMVLGTEQLTQGVLFDCLISALNNF